MNVKTLKEATYEEFKELEYLVSLKSREGGGNNTDLLQKLFNTFIGPTSLCRSCPSQLASAMALLKLRWNLNKEFLINKYGGVRCVHCKNLFKPNHHATKYCDNCKKYKAR